MERKSFYMIKMEILMGNTIFKWIIFTLNNNLNHPRSNNGINAIQQTPQNGPSSQNHHHNL